MERHGIQSMKLLIRGCAVVNITLLHDVNHYFPADTPGASPQCFVGEGKTLAFADRPASFQNPQGLLPEGLKRERRKNIDSNQKQDRSDGASRPRVAFGRSIGSNGKTSERLQGRCIEAPVTVVLQTTRLKPEMKCRSSACREQQRLKPKLSGSTCTEGLQLSALGINQRSQARPDTSLLRQPQLPPRTYVPPRRLQSRGSTDPHSLSQLPIPLKQGGAAHDGSPAKSHPCCRIAIPRVQLRLAQGSVLTKLQERTKIPILASRSPERCQIVPESGTLQHSQMPTGMRQHFQIPVFGSGAKHNPVRSLSTVHAPPKLQQHSRIPILTKFLQPSERKKSLEPPKIVVKSQLRQLSEISASVDEENPQTVAFGKMAKKYDAASSVSARLTSTTKQVQPSEQNELTVKQNQTNATEGHIRHSSVLSDIGGFIDLRLSDDGDFVEDFLKGHSIAQDSESLELTTEALEVAPESKQVTLAASVAGESVSNFWDRCSKEIIEVHPYVQTTGHSALTGAYVVKCAPEKYQMFKRAFYGGKGARLLAERLWLQAQKRRLPNSALLRIISDCEHKIQKKMDRELARQSLSEVHKQCLKEAYDECLKVKYNYLTSKELYEECLTSGMDAPDTLFEL